MAEAFLDELATKNSVLAEEVGRLKSFYERKLWHQLTMKLEECVALPGFQKGDTLIVLYHSFVSEFAHRMNYLKLAQIAVVVGQQYQEVGSAIAFLESVVAKLEDYKEDTRTAEPILYVRMQISGLKLEIGDEKGCKTLVDEGLETLEKLKDPDPAVHAATHWASAKLYKVRKDFAGFYESAMRYLAYITTSALPADTRLGLAVDISLAALLADGVFSFAELLAHPIHSALEGTPSAWLLELTRAFQAGDLHAYDALCNKYAVQMNSQPTLVQHEKGLREKMKVMTLMAAVFELPAGARSLKLTDVSERTKLDADAAERLIMKALSEGLMKGTIDGVEGTARITWAQPRALGMDQVAALSGRLDTWISKVKAASAALSEMAPVAEHAVAAVAVA